MKSTEVILGGFYTTKSHGTVRVMADALVKGHFVAWEQDAQDPITVPARELVKPVFVLSYLDDCVPAVRKYRSFDTRAEAEDYAEHTLGSYFDPRIEG
jgi:hypothetical protein